MLFDFAGHRRNTSSSSGHEVDVTVRHLR